MIKNERKISILDYLILLLVGVFFCIVYFYASIIWPREEKFKNADRSRMERIDNAQQLYYVLTNDYTEDGRILFSLMESIKDTLNGDSFFEGEKKIILAKKNKKYVVNHFNNVLDTILINESASKSVEFSEGVKLFSEYLFKNMGFKDIDSDSIKEQIQRKIIKNMISYSTSNVLKPDQKHLIKIEMKDYSYSMKEYNNFVSENIYSIGNNKWDLNEEFIDDNDNSKWDQGELFTDSDIFYKSLINDKVLYDKDLEDVTYVVDVPPGFKNRLDTTFTNPIKIEQFYEDSIYSVRILNLEPTDNFIDSNNNNKWDDEEQFYDIIYLNSRSLVNYKGEEFIDSNKNKIWDKREKYKDSNKNGEYNPPKESYLGVIPNQDVIYSVLMQGDNGIIELPSYKYEKYLKENKVIDKDIKDQRDVDFKVVSRKKIDMDYFSNADTLTIDSLYSSINFFKHGYNQKDLFEINIIRFEDESYKLKLGNYNSSNLNDEPDDKFINNYDSEEILVSLPFVSNPINTVFYYKKMDPPNITIKSPVPSRENWAYWQKIDLIAINDIDKSDYNISSFSVPTPFSFYTGDKDKIVDHVKSWID